MTQNKYVRPVQEQYHALPKQQQMSAKQLALGKQLNRRYNRLSHIIPTTKAEVTRLEAQPAQYRDVRFSNNQK